MSVWFYSSVTRITDLADQPMTTQRLGREHWADHDYVVGEVIGPPNSLYQVELASGRMVKALPGDHVVGTLGHRAATLEGVGSWTEITGDAMQALTAAGLFGRFTSLSPLLPLPMRLEYRGHVMRNAHKLSMSDFAIQSRSAKLDAAVVLLVGTSMSAGKTTTGRLIVHELASLGLNVVGAKLTGAGRFRDILSFRDAGASAIFDFIDAGLPSTVVSETVFTDAVRPLLDHIASRQPDVLVIEAGASPLEPYNGAAAISLVKDQVRCTVLCASDPYAVVGVQQAFGLQPDLVAGPAANTSAAIELVSELTGIEALNVLEPSCLPALHKVLERTLSVRF